VIGNRSERERGRTRLAHFSRLFAVIFVALATAWWSEQTPLSRDVTRSQSHTLSDASIAVLSTLPEPIRIQAYVPKKSPLRGQIDHLLNRYRRQRSDIELQYFDPADDPEQARAEQIRNGELLISSAGRNERISEYSEQALTEALARLARSADRWVVFVSGHGERSPRRVTNHDVSDWADVLEKRGINVQEINLAEFPNVPDNTTVLVIASPRLNFQAGETNAVLSYLNDGGNILWLAEPDSPSGLAALERGVGFERVPGTIVDPLSVAKGIDNPAFLLLNRYFNHPAISGFNFTTVLFYATAIHERAAAGWNAVRLIYSSDKSWSETDPLDGNVGYEKASDIIGPLPLAIALTRKIDGREQRTIVVGDGDFVANAYIQNSGNQDLGVRFIEWLARDDALVAVPSRAARDHSLALKDWHKAVIGFTFLIGLPAAFVLNGVLIWWRRRRA
jgi:ABC-type uncharacterized transport system involved in gliding motility auxiliary subunit